MKQVKINFNLEKAWEVWIAEVPDHADENWIRENPDEVEMLDLHECGNDGMAMEEVEFL